MRYLYSSKNHGWRDAYNPLRGLNLSRLTALQEAGERGQYADLQAAAEEILAEGARKARAEPALVSTSAWS